MESIVPYKEAFSKYIPEQYKNSEKLLSLVNTCLDQCDSLENAFFEILQALNLQDAIGPALDWLGAIVGVERIPGESDTSYRSRIVSGMNLKNLPSNEALRLVIKFLTGCDSVGLFPNWPAETYYVLDGSTDADLSALEHDSMTSGASLVRGTFLCMESGEGGYIVNDDNGMPFVVDYVDIMDIPDNVLRFTFSNPDYDPTVAGVGPHGTWTKVATSNQNEWDWATEGVSTSGEFKNAFRDSSNFVSVRCKRFESSLNAYELFYNNSSLISAHLQNVTGIYGSGVSFFENCSNLKNIVLIGANNIDTISYFAGYCSNLESVSIDALENCASLNAAFTNCTKLKDVRIGDISNVTNLYTTFRNCSSLESVYLDIPSVTTCYQAFYGCSKLKNVILKNTGNVENLNGTFSQCVALETAPSLDTSSCTNFNSVFFNCESLKEVPVYETSNVTNFNLAFTQCENLEYIRIDVSSALSMESMFEDCTSLRNVEFIGNTGNTENFSRLFVNCSSLKNIPFFDTSSAENVNEMFNGCINVESGAVEMYEQMIASASISSYSYCFKDCGVATLRGIGNLCKIPTSWGGLGPLSANTLLFSFSKSDYSPTVAGLNGTWAQFDTGYSENTFNLWTWQDLSSNWIRKFYDSTTQVGTFVDPTNLVDIIAAGDTSSVTTVKQMFTSNTSLNSICLFDTSSVVDFSSFVSHTGIFELPLFDTSHATTINSIAYDCKNLLHVPLLNTSAITNVNGISVAFYDCINVESGAYELYKQLQSQTFTGGVYLPFSNCGNNKLTGISDLLKIPSEWGGLNSNLSANSVIVSFANSNFDPSDEMPIASGSWSRVSDISNFNAWKFTSSGTDLSEVFKDKFRDAENLVYILGAGTSSVVNVDSMLDGCTAVEGGALNLYKQMSTQTTPLTNHADTFFDCGTLTENGTVELLGISCHWGGNDLYSMLTDDYVGFMPDAAETDYFIEYIRMYQDLVAMFRNIETKRIYI